MKQPLTLTPPSFPILYLCIDKDDFNGGAKGHPWVRAGRPMCAKLPPLCHTNIIAGRPLPHDNKTLSASLSPQLTAAAGGDKWDCVDASTQPVSPRLYSSLTSLTKADQSAKHSTLQAKTTHLIVARYTRQGVYHFNNAGA